MPIADRDIPHYTIIGIVGKITDIVFHDKVVDIASDKLASDSACK